MSDVLGSGATDAAPEPDRGPSEGQTDLSAGDAELSSADPATSAAAKRRRRGTRGGRGRNRTRVNGSGPDGGADDDDQPELPDRPIEGKVQSPEVADRVLVRRPPRIGDSRPAPPPEPESPLTTGKPAANGPRKRRRGATSGRASGGSGRSPARAVVSPAAVLAPVELDEETLERRRGRERKGRPIGRYLMAVHVTPEHTQIAVLEGRSLIEHYVSRPADDIGQIHGNV